MSDSAIYYNGRLCYNIKSNGIGDALCQIRHDPCVWIILYKKKNLFEIFVWPMCQM